MRTDLFREGLNRDNYDPIFRKIYKDNPRAQNYQRQRYLAAINSFSEKFGQREFRLFSTPGRTEVGGNHTDHNAGHVLAAAVDLDVLAVAGVNNSDEIRVWSEGYGLISVNLHDLAVHKDRYYTSEAIIAGTIKGLADRGFQIGGFDAYITSDVLQGSGLSSSAAFEVCITTILNHLFNQGRIDDVTNARISQYAENEYFGKPCGLMDQTTCAVGGFVEIDFLDFANPGISRVDYDFSRSGYTLCVIDTGGNHADLNDDYAALENEMKSVARVLGKSVLRQTSKDEVLANVEKLRRQVNDRAILRAIHFFDDDRKVLEMVDSLKNGDIDKFLHLITASGHSSFMHCQNVYTNSHWQEQGLAVALMLSENILQGQGAWRVHGGGFAGTIQAFVPDDLLDTYRQQMSSVFGEKSFYELMIRPYGTIEIKTELI